MKEAPPILLALALLANNCKGKTLQLFCRSVGGEEKKFYNLSTSGQCYKT